MSTGVFEPGKYMTNDGTVFKCRPQPETKTFNVGAVNAYPAGAVIGVGSARLSSSQKRKGVNARTVRFKFTVAVDGYEDGSTLTLPIFQQSVWNGISQDDTGTYMGTPIIVLGKSPEGIK